MNTMKLVTQNFKRSMQNYFSLILSLAFTILIFYNFLNVIFTDTFLILGQQNKSYIDSIIAVISIVLVCFMFCYIWYATNVFLTKRKKEIGIYVFMGLTNQKIGKMYMLETILIGITAYILGIGFGVITTQLFQMILLAISDISVEIAFRFSLEPIVITAAIYFIVYFIFVLKGYVNIVRSSVLDMISANRQNEYVKTKTWILVIKTIFGIAILITGYQLAIKEGKIGVMMNMAVVMNIVVATVLVIIGIYLMFGGCLPFVFQKLADNKRFLYCKERNLWINSVIFRTKKNYRTYAMVCVLMLCAVTALATSFAMKERYHKIIHFRNTYTYQVLSTRADMQGQLEGLIEQDNDIVYQTALPILVVDASLFATDFTQRDYAIVKYSDMKTLAKEIGEEFVYEELKEDEIIKISHIILLSLIVDRSEIKVMINGKEYRQIEDTNTAYLGYLQEQRSFYMVNDEEYEKLMSLGQQLYMYNFYIDDIYNFEASRDELQGVVNNSGEDYMGLVVINPHNSDIEWIKVMYSICIFMFLVFVMASVCILFMKLYNDAFEEKERYKVLKKLGFDSAVLGKAIRKELRVAYVCPFLLMAVSSYFSVHSLEKMMNTDLGWINFVSVAIIFVFFLVFYEISVVAYRRNAGVKE
ncbi:MAG: ABC transporter permease [Lachnospiraceae bacterium]|nr:ABC transporter permease [Lachnospiraceae bacterium]